MSQTVDNSPPYRIAIVPHDNGNRAGRFLNSMDDIAPCRDDDVKLKADQFSREVRLSSGIRLAPADFKDYVFSFDVAQLAQTLPECLNERRRRGSGRGNEEPYPVTFPRLLRLSEMDSSPNDKWEYGENYSYLHGFLTTLTIVIRKRHDRAIDLSLYQVTNVKACVYYRDPSSNLMETKGKESARTYWLMNLRKRVVMMLEFRRP
jgi:hypothetical protein